VATIDDFRRVFNAYVLPPNCGGSIEKGDNMEKTVKITGFEEKEGTKGMYWKVSTSPALIPKKALFIHNEEQVQLLEKDKHYHFVYSTNDKGFIEVTSFEETEDINQDMKDEKESSTQSGDSRTNSILLQVSGKIAAVEVRVHNLDEMTNAEIHSYTQSLARSWFTMFKNEGQ